MRNEALVEPELISWVRNETKVPIEDIASSVGVTVSQILEWEEGKSAPTIRQLRLVAKKCRVPFAAFYLSEPPEIKIPKIRDYRNIGLSLEHADSHILHFEIRHALDIRSIITELSGNEIAVDIWPSTSIRDSNIEQLAGTIRKILNIDFELQKKWRDPRVAYNFCRDAFEKNNVLVFQTSELDTGSFRALSIYFNKFPVIILNRKDSYSGRMFSMFHELIHICMRSSGICDMSPNDLMIETDRTIEIFCNAVASEIFVPNRLFMAHDLVKNNSSYSERIMELIAKDFCCSKEVIARKLLESKLIDREYYESIRERSISDYLTHIKKKGGFVPPAVDIVSLIGRRPLIELMVAVDSGKINSNEFSEYTGIKIKHLETLRRRL